MKHLQPFECQQVSAAAKKQPSTTVTGSVNQTHDSRTHQNQTQANVSVQNNSSWGTVQATGGVSSNGSNHVGLVWSVEL